MKLNNEGASMVDVVVGLFLILMTLGFLFQFSEYLKNAKERQEISSILFDTIHNETELVYRVSDWANLEDFDFSTNWGEVHTSFSNYHVTVHDTESIDLKVQLSGKENSVTIERSILP